MNQSLFCNSVFFVGILLSNLWAIPSDEPKSAKTPLRVGTKNKTRSTPNKSGNHSEMTSNVRKPPSPSAASLFPLRIEQPPVSSSKARSSSKKVQQTVEQQRRHDYAQQLFDDLNASIFKGGLPNNTALNWNKRLLTTAGRAKWHR
jgi:hypothetical protein